MPDLELLRADHASALLDFEEENRGYFAAWIPDRGDAYFATFDERHREELAWQAEGSAYFHVLVEEDGRIVGRVNLWEVADDSADVGYRIAAGQTGRGLATGAVRQVCELAVGPYGLSVLEASVSAANPASRAVLERAGFVPTGDVVLSGRPGTRFRLELRPPRGSVDPPG